MSSRHVDIPEPALLTLSSGYPALLEAKVQRVSAGNTARNTVSLSGAHVKPVPHAAIEAIGPTYRHVYLSPHFDDVALSAGGIALLQRRRSEPILVVSVFTASPGGTLTRFAEFQHGRWGVVADPWQERQEEERAAMTALGTDYLWLDYPDAIYRGDQYLSDADLFGPIKDGDAELRRALANDVVRISGRCPGATVYLPLGAGNHVDHQLCAGVMADLRAARANVAWYEDYPYAMHPGAVARRLEDLGGTFRPLVVEIGRLVDEKVRLVGLYRSQASWIFRHHGTPEGAIRRYAASLTAMPGGYAERLWLDDERGEP